MITTMSCPANGDKKPHTHARMQSTHARAHTHNTHTHLHPPVTVVAQESLRLRQGAAPTGIHME
jgi:hypothetical protein